MEKENTSILPRWKEFFILPEDNKTTTAVFGSSEGLRKEKKRASQLTSWVIHPYSTFRKYWLVLVILATFLNVIVIPMSVSFFTNAVHNSATWIAVNIVVDILFVADLCLNFRIGYWTEGTEVVILDVKEIKTQYLKSWFIPDLIAVMPIDYVILIVKTLGHASTPTGVAGLRVVKLIKLTRLFSLLRLLRFSRLLRYVRDCEEAYGMSNGGLAEAIQFLHFIVLIVLICHWCACFHFMVANIGDFPANSWITKEGLQNKTMSVQYSRCMFRALCHMMTLNYGSVGVPKGVEQLWVDIISMMMGAVMYALVLAHITAIVTHSGASENVYAHKYNEMCQYMRQCHLPPDLLRRILDHLSCRYLGRYFDEEEILKDLNEPLRRAIIHHNCINFFENHPVFKGASPLFIEEVLEMLKFEFYMAGDLIIRKGDIGDCMYFIEKGDVQVETGTSAEVLSDGSFFGEFCLVTKMNRRCCNVKALSLCRLYSLSASDYLEVVQRFPELLQDVGTVARQRLNSMVPVPVDKADVEQIEDTADAEQVDISFVSVCITNPSNGQVECVGNNDS
ncbi:potassium/sodium hyperpolarization-activated cyclic nucleotide-gated channel 1-like [Engraulis encrasicolus]|uniref:potassium/sodium hyperpolarization-activated cyclic nucleotide-gated channel 1-like n=1 Tax=Engraulis encrasicolus TaxID=184585 RepID=UPI002FD40CF2